jgi:hypothetical protein
VRALYTLDGRKIGQIGELEDGQLYVCAGDSFKKVDYNHIAGKY